MAEIDVCTEGASSTAGGRADASDCCGCASAGAQGAPEVRAQPSARPDSSGEADLLRALYEEVRGLRESVREITNRLSNTAPAQAVRAISIEAAQDLLGCGRSRIFELLRSGALRRAPKLGKVAMIDLPSLKALIDGIDHEPAPKLKRERAPKLKRRPAQRNAGRGEKDEILKLIRRA
ncbi:hypothetical protein [Archangium sp. Cb G35]|uniref:hypothetical protein n=1 Tax=Archangium sp. Cb G35 TaxID=1920190 RepID=UPI000937701E|nr:hypothetical protein [Archangium sp. Cb G35]